MIESSTKRSKEVVSSASHNAFFSRCAVKAVFIWALCSLPSWPYLTASAIPSRVDTHERGQGLEALGPTTIPPFGSFNSQRLGLAVETLSRGAVLVQTAW